MNPYFLRPITPPQMMPYPFYRPPIPYAPVPQAPMQAAAAGGLGAAGAAGGGLNGFLANANALMTNAEKFTPYVQQLSPMMKNLPALWRMYKSFKSTPESPAAPIAPASAPVQQQRQNESPIRSIQRQPTNSPQPVPLTPRPSVPKIYQPTWPI